MCTAVAVGIVSGIMSVGQAIAANAAQNAAIDAANLSDQFQYDYNMLSAKNQRQYEANQEALRNEQMFQNQELASGLHDHQKIDQELPFDTLHPDEFEWVFFSVRKY